MKKDIHTEYKETAIKCACGNEVTVGSTKTDITVEICSKCHPFYTGKRKLVDNEGRVDKFNAKRNAADDFKSKNKEPKKRKGKNKNPVYFSGNDYVAEIIYIFHVPVIF